MMTRKIFDPLHGEFPPVNIGHVVVADDGVVYKSLKILRKRLKRCTNNDEMMCVIHDTAGFYDKLFFGEVLGRNDSHVTLREWGYDKMKQFKPELIIAVYPHIEDLDKGWFRSPTMVNKDAADVWNLLGWS